LKNTQELRSIVYNLSIIQKMKDLEIAKKVWKSRWYINRLKNSIN
jgi:hypothetical protein